MHYTLTLSPLTRGQSRSQISIQANTTRDAILRGFDLFPDHYVSSCKPAKKHKYGLRCDFAVPVAYQLPSGKHVLSDIQFINLDHTKMTDAEKNRVGYDRVRFIRELGGLKPERLGEIVEA